MPVRLTDDQLATYVAEAEDGYDLDRLSTRGRGPVSYTHLRAHET